MLKKLRTLFAAKNVALITVISFFFMQCAEEELIQPQMNETPSPAVISEAVTVSSLTISGIHTIVSENVDCTSCTYVVPLNTATVDGSELKLKPGSVICLDKAKEYGMLELVNLVGSEEKPIVIGYCGE